MWLRWKGSKRIEHHALLHHKEVWFYDTAELQIKDTASVTKVRQCRRTEEYHRECVRVMASGHQQHNEAEG